MPVTRPAGARARLLLAAAATGWSALAVGTAVSPLSPWVAFGAALAVPVVWAPWAPAARAVPLVTGAACVALVATGAPPWAASVVGALVLLHVVVADLAGDAVGATGRAVGVALRGLLPGLASGSAAALLLGVGTALGAALPDTVAAALWLLAPFVLLVAALLALGLDTRRPAWTWLSPSTGLSALTRRYRERVREER